jgi:predicted short-subunit dehydrogenase-like oxidoreductase (DUF2520 family)
MRVRIIGPGRAGKSFSFAFTHIGWDVVGHLGKDDEVANAAREVDLVLLTVPDGIVEDVAGQIEPNDSVVIAHVAGSLTLDVLGHHKRTASCHPLLTLPNPSIGKDRLLSGAWFAVAGDPVVAEIVKEFGGHSFEVSDSNRVLYHAAACVAANHLVVLLGQVKRLSEIAEVPFEAYINLVSGALDSVKTLGPEKALTGPAARGDRETIESHLAVLPKSEIKLYRQLVEAAQEFATEFISSQNVK